MKQLYISVTLMLSVSAHSATVLTTQNAWTETGIVSPSNDGMQNNNGGAGSYTNWGGAAYVSSAANNFILMSATTNNIQSVFTPGYTYEYKVKGVASDAGSMTNMTAKLQGNSVILSQVTSPNNDGSFGIDHPGLILGSYAVSNQACVGKTIKLRIQSEGPQTRFLADGESWVKARLTQHADFNGDGVIYSTVFTTNNTPAVLEAQNYVLDMSFAASGGAFGVENGSTYYRIINGTSSRQSFSISSQDDCFREATVYKVSFVARKAMNGDPSQNMITVSLGSFSTNLVIGTSLAAYTIEISAEDAANAHELLGCAFVAESTTANGSNQYRIYSCTISATHHQRLGRWYEDNNMNMAGGVPPNFFSRYNDVSGWTNSLAEMDVYYIRSSVYGALLKTNAQAKAAMAAVMNYYHIAVAIDEGAATKIHVVDHTVTPDYSSSRDMIRDLQSFGWNVKYIGLQSVLSKPPANGTTYDMVWRIRDIVEYVKQVKAEFPLMQIGIIDALAAKQKDYTGPYSDLKTALADAGYTLDFIHQDFPIDYAIVGTRVSFGTLLAVEQYVQNVIGCTSGLFLSSARGSQTSDELYRSDVVSGLQTYLTNGGAPQHVTLGSWNPYPACDTPDEPDPALNPNGSTMLGTFLLTDEVLRSFGK